MTSRPGTVDEVQRLVDELAADLGRSVVVNDPAMHLLHASRHFADEDPVRIRAVLQRDPGPEVADHVLGLGVAEWDGPGVIPASPALSLRARLCVPVRRGTRFLGLLLVIDGDGTLTAGEVDRVAEAADAVAAGLAERELEASRVSAETERRVAALLDDSAPGRAAAHRALVAGGLPDRPALVTTVEVGVATDAGARPAEVARALRGAAAGHLRRERAAGAVVVDVSGRPRVRAVVVGVPDGDAARDAARRFAAAVRRALGPDVAVHVGSGGPVPDLGSAWRSAREAALAVRAARLLPRLDGVARFADVGDHAVLLRLPDEALVPDLLPAPLRLLLDHEAGPRLRHTLEVYLDQAGSVPRTADLLHLHRTSLYYRLRRISEITGADLDDGTQRLVLHQGLRALELLEGRG